MDQKRPVFAPVSSVSPGHQKIFLGAVMLLGAGVAALLFFFNPAEHGFFPRCYFRAFTGWDCPGCGGLRAAHQLLHGEVRAAFTLNPLLVLALPLLGYFAVRFLLARFLGRQLPQPFRSGHWIWVAAVVVVAFGVARNFPWWPRL
jgi:Protein of unknown function (DUF2752)